MFNSDKIKAILCDYGGTIDSNGMHWAEVIWQSYQTMQIPVSKELFRQAYIYGERTLAQNRIVLPHHNFWHVLRLKVEAQLQWLLDNKHLPDDDRAPHYIASVADWCYTYAQICINQARPILKNLSEQYPIVLVTNFYGNMQAVLEDFYLATLFVSVIESSVVGIRKPNPDIFRLGMEQLGLAPHEVVVIGDSYHKDILPASSLGCCTIWLKKTGWEPEVGNESADIITSDFAALKDIFRTTETGGLFI
ncbi:MAG: HAD family hydrolase [Tannerellaceae bacterium]|nr:HAD family hydrolase [Tannerellaceae bacterium]